MFEVILGRAIGQALQGLQTKDPLLQELQGWSSRLVEHAPGRWRAVVMSGIACDMQGPSGGPCRRPAVGACVVCRKPTCLAHALVSAGADVVCFRCVKAAQVAVGNAPPESPAAAPDARAVARAHLKTLGLPADATLDQVHRAFKKLAAKNHPDKAKTPEKRAAAEVRFKKISEAYHYLERHMSAQKAA